MERAREDIRQLDSAWEVVAENVTLAGARLVDVGCGTGELVRWATPRGAHAVGLDTPEMLARAVSVPKVGGETYLAGAAQQLPLGDRVADCLVYFASLHHVPPARLDEALAECHRVLRLGGRAVFVEPVALPGSYYEIVRLAEDEAGIQKLAHAALGRAAGSRLGLLKEELCFLERSFEDYERCLQTFIADRAVRQQALAEARVITQHHADDAGVPFEAFRYRSTCRLTVLERPSEKSHS